METKTLILGLLFSFGVFAAKSGAGLSYLLSSRKTVLQKAGVALAWAVLYLLVFAVAWLGIKKFNPLAWLESLDSIFRGIMAFHFIMVAILFAWGAALLFPNRCKDGSGAGKTRAWMALVAPCPGCLAVIFLSGALLDKLSPGPALLFPLLSVLFVVMGLASAAFFAFFNNGAGAERRLGTVMIMLSLYFLLTIAIVPHFDDAKRIYRLSKGGVVSGPGADQLAWLVAGAAAAFGIGIIMERQNRRAREKVEWN